MTRATSKFAGGDQDYLRQEQYRDASRLTQRANLHERYGTAAIGWHEWVGRRLDLRPGQRVLEVGCGAGWLWDAVERLLPESLRLTLTDLSAGMVAEATERAAHATAAVTGAVADAGHLPVSTRSADRVIANHMLYHLPDPRRAVAELARVVRQGGTVTVATNGRRHMQELMEIRAEVFGVPPVNETVDVFGAEVGFGMLRDQFGDVHWERCDDELRCTNVDDVVAYVCSSPPAEDATDDERARLRAAIVERFDAGGGVMTITKDVGCFTCRDPRRATGARRGA